MRRGFDTQLKPKGRKFDFMKGQSQIPTHPILGGVGLSIEFESLYLCS